MKKRFILTVITSLMLGVASTQVLQENTKTINPSAGVSAERLSKVDRLIQSYIDSGWINGATAIVARKGHIVYHKGLGKNGDQPLQRDAIVRIASQTKAITSVAVMMLYEDGHFLLDDPISKFIPAFKNPKVIYRYNEKDTTFATLPASKEISIRHLLTHTSGIHYAQIGNAMFNAIYAKHNIFSGIGGEENRMLGEMVDILGTMPLAHNPGERFTYGLNTDVLGRLVEVVSGMSLEAFFEQRIFKPLGMKDTYFYLPESKKHRFAKLYTHQQSSVAVPAPPKMNINGNFYPDYPIGNGKFFSGGGGLSSTAYDYAIFMQMLLNEGVYNGKRLLSRSAVRLMTTNQIGDLYINQHNKFGLGFEIVTTAGSAYTARQEGSYNWGGMFSSTYWIDPAEKLVAQLFLQLYPNTKADIHERFKTAVYQALND